MSDKKSELIEELNRILMVHDVSWQLLPQEDLERLVSAFRKLKCEFDEVFKIVDEILEQPLTVVEDSKQEWRRYCT